MYNDLKWQYISPSDDHFINYINNNYAENSHYKTLYPYIYAAEIKGSDGEPDKTIRAHLVVDDHLGLFELPHLAIVIRCYLQSPVPGEWSAWAGDFATGVKEVYTMGVFQGFLACAVERLGYWEPDVSTPETSRQFNYYDLIADLDGYAIRELLRTTPSLSECIQIYYSDPSKYDKRYQYFKNILGFENWDLTEINLKILDYFYSEGNTWLRVLFASKYTENPGSVESTALVLAHNILYWAKYTNVSMT